MMIGRGLSSLRDRPVPDDERRGAVVAIIAFLALVALLLAFTHSSSRPAASPPASSTPSRPAPATVPHGGDVPPGVAAGVARAFLSGYLAYAYAGRPAGSVIDATPQLVQSLKDHPPRVRVALHTRLPRIVALHFADPQSGQLAVNAIVNDGGIVDYAVNLLVARRGGQIVVTALEGGQ